MKYDMWQRNRIVGAITRACCINRPPGSGFTPLQRAFMEGAKALDDFSPDYFITASGGREVPRKYFKQYGLKVKRKVRRQHPANGHRSQEGRGVMERAYTDISISKSVNVSSTGHYTGKLYYKHRGKRTMRYVDLSNGYVMSTEGAELKLPAYVHHFVWPRFVDLLTSSDVIFYEYDRDHEKRFSNLRYHAPETVAWIVGHLTQDNASPPTR